LIFEHLFLLMPLYMMQLCWLLVCEATDATVHDAVMLVVGM
jgi:hypothetical protein